MRKRVYEIIEPSRNGDKPSLAYDIFMLIAITVSIVPLMFVEDTKTFRIIEQITVSMLSSLFGVAIIALPSGVITASYLEELRAQRGSNNEIEE